MLEPVRFSVHDPVKLTSELDRFVASVRRELAEATARAAARYTPRTITFGTPGQTVVAGARFGDLIGTNTALGPVDVALPKALIEDAGRSVLVTVRNVTNPVTLRPGGGLVNGASATYALPSALGAYLVFWDGSGWWTVNDA